MRALITSPERTHEVALYLLRFASQILPLTPCTVTKASQTLANCGAIPDVQQGVEDILYLARELPNVVVVELEKVVDSYLIFYHLEALQAMVEDRTCHPTSATESLSVTSLSIDELFKERVPYLATLRINITMMANAPTVLERRTIEQIKDSFPELPVTKFCDSNSYKECLKAGKTDCKFKIHFEKIETANSDNTDCSYLDTCFKGKQCRFVHYRIRYPSVAPEVSNERFDPMQYINANLLELDLSLLGHDYAALIIDPPWDIHTRPDAQGVCNDEAVKSLAIEQLQHEGVVFLWVTGRVLEFGRQCLTKWGYTHQEELVWIKTNQLGKTICTGRTGHWLNHTKEHVLIGSKQRGASEIGRVIDTDVIVSNALGKSQKPEELYGIIDRLVGRKAKKLELFGRKENCRPGWLTIGNEIGSTHITDPKLYNSLFRSRS